MSFTWIEDRPEVYDPSLVYDELTETWVADDGRGGARYRNTFLVIAQNDDGAGRVFVSL